MQVEVNGRPFTVGVKEVPAAEGDDVDPLPVASPAPAAGATAPPARVVTAPLPGTIKSVQVRPDQQVSTGDELLVIEAMKMDNIIRATREGVIGTVYVAQGRQVSHGEEMLEYQE